MTCYTRIWRAAAGLLATAGVALGFMTQPTSVVLGALAAAAAIALSLGLGMSVGTVDQDEPIGFLPVFVVSFCVVGAFALLVVGVFTIVAIAALITGSSPFVLHRVLGLGAADHEPSIFGAQRDDRLQSKSMAELAEEWRRTYVALQGAPSAKAKIAVVKQREAVLDELERRDSEGIQVWLESECRAGGDPTTYMQRRDGGSAAG